jgi:hypothetical protein
MKTGRPKTGTRYKQRCIEIDESDWAKLREHGSGTRKLGLKRLVEYAENSGFIPVTKGKK